MITVVGLGPGASDYLTSLASQAIAKAEWIIGSDRQLALVKDHHANIRVLDKSLPDLLNWLRRHMQEEVVVLASGEPMLYGIGKLISKELGDQGVRIVPGISSVQYLLAQVGLDMNDIYLTSTHGKAPDFDFLLQHTKVALMTDKKTGPFEIAQEIINRGLSRKMIIGEKLSYEDEKITIIAACDVKVQNYQMNVVVIIDER